MSTKQNALAYTIVDGVVRQVRVSSNGNLVDACEPSRCYALARCRLHSQPWPPIYPTADAADAVQDAVIAACTHDWRVLSHEEIECRICKTVRLIPDVD